jgi:hypothetical protein
MILLFVWIILICWFYGCLYSSVCLVLTLIEQLSLRIPVHHWKWAIKSKHRHRCYSLFESNWYSQAWQRYSSSLCNARKTFYYYTHRQYFTIRTSIILCVLIIIALCLIPNNNSAPCATWVWPTVTMFLLREVWGSLETTNSHRQELSMIFRAFNRNLRIN